MEEKEFHEEWDRFVENGHEIISKAAIDNEEIYKQCNLLLMRTMRMIRFAMVSGYSHNKLVPTMIVEKEKELIMDASNNIVNEIKMMTNVKDF